MRRRILLLVAGVTVLVVLAFAVPLAVLIDAEVVQRQRNATAAEAGFLAAFIGGAVRGNGDPAPVAAIRHYLAALPADGRRAAVTLPDGRSIGSAGVPEPAGGNSPAGPPFDHGFAPPTTTVQRVAGGGGLAFAGVPALDGFYVARVYAPYDALHAGETGWWLLLGGGSAALLLLGIGAGEVVTRRITRPLVRTADTALRMSAGDVAARAPVAGPPEVAAVGAALNRLGDRIDELIAEERETVADLSHRLRTPLTALRLDAESLHDRAEAERIGGHVTALERMLTAVIRAARRPEREGRVPSCDARAVVGERVAFWSALTEEQDRPADISLPPRALPVRAAAEDLAAAVDALLENVVAHTPEGTPFSVHLAAAPGGARLDIADAGPGFSPEAVGRGRSDRGSTGLGLDIARRCAERTGGQLTVGRSPAGGALVTLDLHAP